MTIWYQNMYQVLPYRDKKCQFHVTFRTVYAQLPSEIPFPPAQLLLTGGVEPFFSLPLSPLYAMVALLIYSPIFPLLPRPFPAAPLMIYYYERGEGEAVWLR